MRFEDNILFKEVVKKYFVAKGVKLRFLKNEPLRTRVCCKEKCPWKLYASHDKRCIEVGIEGCRPFIGVDGCFLKTVSKGALLVAISRDGNNQMFSVVWVVVEGEGKESWR
ncbi:hypothetical protein V6N13_028222 [Hibiscus sabdariffa]